MWCSRAVCLISFIAIGGCAVSENYAPVVNRSRIETIKADHYRVQTGDTLYSIAWASELDFRQLAAMNHLKAPYALHPGDLLKVKLPSGKVAHLEEPSRLPLLLERPRLAHLSAPLFSEKLPLKSTPKKTILNNETNGRAQVSMPGSARFSAPSANETNAQKQPPIYDSKNSHNEINEHAPIKDLIFTKKAVHSWMWPVRGKIVGQFSSGQLGNKGLDITGQYGQPVKACESGVVVYSGSGLRGYGNLIIIKHNASFLSAYAHNSELKVTEGTQVKAGQEIALMGRAPSGDVMLHFEIRRDGKPVNPIQFLR